MLDLIFLACRVRDVPDRENAGADGMDGEDRHWRGPRY